ncbi:hypothetical protein EVAR_71251_1 [Eumeta japonica]|uniref:Retrotransposon gag domain-containing protein n=1 Tax=Eumeta variegata TaxID=151549 RepID=A0A4C1SKZ8_EUMVA|nr:hypothetical protein EVAR_71251_1 [Eumeta japonica]
MMQRMEQTASATNTMLLQEMKNFKTNNQMLLREINREINTRFSETCAEVLETVPASCRNNYEDIVAALQRKYGGEHRKEIHRVELRGRVQKMNETLQDYALEIERLVQLAYPGENHPFMDNFKAKAFVIGIRDPGAGESRNHHIRSAARKQQLNRLWFH